MATTTGFVQRLSVFGTAQACAWIGPTPTNTELLVVVNDGSAGEVAFAASAIDTLGAAMMHRREVAAGHGDTSSAITAVTINPI